MASVVYGAGGHARELRYELESNGEVVAAFVDDFHSDRVVDGVPVLSFASATEKLRKCVWFVAIGDPRGRETIVRRVRSENLRFGQFISPNARVLPSAGFGDGVQVFSNSVISASVRVGDFAII